MVLSFAGSLPYGVHDHYNVDDGALHSQIQPEQVVSVCMHGCSCEGPSSGAWMLL